MAFKSPSLGQLLSNSTTAGAIIGSGTSTDSLSSITALTVAKGGTGLSTLTANYIPYGNGTSAFQSSSGFVFDGAKLGVGTTPSSNTIGHFYTSTSGVSNKLMLETVSGSNAAISVKAANEWWWFAGSSGNSGRFILYDATNGVVSMMVDPVTGYIGVASAPLTNSALTISPSYTKQSYNQYGSYNYINYNPASAEGTYAVYGMLNQAIKNGSSALNAGYAQIVGSQQAALNAGSGNLDGMTGGYFAVQNIGTGTVTTGLGVGILTPTAALVNPITTMKGLYIQTMATTGVTNSYGIYIDSGSQYDIYSLGSKNYFAGRFNFGSVAGSTTEGDFWFDSTQKAVQTYMDGIEQTLSSILFIQTADKTVTNTVTETSIVGTGVGGLTLPANFFVAGKTIRITMSGVYSTVAVTGDTVTIKIKYGSTVLASKATTALVTGGSNLLWESEILVTCRTTGASGSVQVSGGVRYQIAGSAIVEDELNNSAATTTLDTTASGLFDITITHSAANGSNTVKSLVGTFEVLN